MNCPPELCVIVLSYRNESHVVDAVESLLRQHVPLEILVSHSGGGPTADLLAPFGDGVRVIESPSRRLPGAARNAGIEATRARWVSFLAADCVALSGWAAARLSRHRRGAPAVASAMAPPSSPRAAIAGYLLQHSSRMPHRDHGPRFHHGVSYAREILERFGPFTEDVPQGEDTWLNHRLLDAGVPIEWAPEVLTAHPYPATAAALLRDRLGRGRRRAVIYRPIHRRLRLLAQVVLEPPLAVSRATAPGSPLPLRDVLASIPLLVAGGVAAAAGVMLGPDQAASPSSHAPRPAAGNTES